MERIAAADDHSTRSTTATRNAKPDGVAGERVDAWAVEHEDKGEPVDRDSIAGNMGAESENVVSWVGQEGIGSTAGEGVQPADDSARSCLDPKAIRKPKDRAYGAKDEPRKKGNVIDELFQGLT